MTALRTHRVPAALLAIALLVPLLHGAGGHRASPGEAATRLSAPVDPGAPGVTDAPCALCVAARTSVAGPARPAPAAPSVAVQHRGTDRERHPVVAARSARPEAARAPPHPLG